MTRRNGVAWHKYVVGGLVIAGVIFLVCDAIRLLDYYLFRR